MAVSLFVLNGPNLNLLGKREPAVYGTATLADIERLCRETAARLDLAIEFRQTNHEGMLVDWVQEAATAAAGLIINPGAYTHTSIALHDALRGLGVPIIEVHLSNIFAREPFRHHSYVSPLASGVICGLGARGYALALEAMVTLVAQRRPAEKAR
jgi:3-dehydroquinate dehydratase-2